MTSDQALIVALAHRYLGGLMDPFITPAEIGRLLYFLREAGAPVSRMPSSCALSPSPYLAPVTDDPLAGDEPATRLEIVPGAFEQAEAVLSTDAARDTRARFERVEDLVDGFESPFGLELLATVHWVATRDGASDPETAIAKVHGRNTRKGRFSPRQIRIALQRLQDGGWLTTAAG